MHPLIKTQASLVLKILIYKMTLTFIQSLQRWQTYQEVTAKTINLGLFYGMGKAKLQAELGVSKEKAEELFSIYHERVPFVKTLTELCI